jgi:hypothetical protein
MIATDGRFEADDNIAENAIRDIALGKRNWLFAGSHSGGERTADVFDPADREIERTGGLGRPQSPFRKPPRPVAHDPAGAPARRFSVISDWTGCPSFLLNYNGSGLDAAAHRQVVDL